MVAIDRLCAAFAARAAEPAAPDHLDRRKKASHSRNMAALLSARGFMPSGSIPHGF